MTSRGAREEVHSGASPQRKPADHMTALPGSPRLTPGAKPCPALRHTGRLSGRQIHSASGQAHRWPERAEMGQPGATPRGTQASAGHRHSRTGSKSRVSVLGSWGPTQAGVWEIAGEVGASPAGQGGGQWRGAGKIGLCHPPTPRVQALRCCSRSVEYKLRPG